MASGGAASGGVWVTDSMMITKASKVYPTMLSRTMFIC
jgi:hypothetical protein